MVDGEIILHWLALLMFSSVGAWVQYAIEGAYSLIASIADAGHESDRSISQIVAHCCNRRRALGARALSSELVSILTAPQITSNWPVILPASACTPQPYLGF